MQLSKRHAPPFQDLLGALPVPNTLPVLPFATEQGTAVLSYLLTPPSLGATKTTILAEHLASHRRAQGPAPQVEATGTIPAEIEQGNLISHNLIWLDIATVLLVLVIVGLHFRAVLPPLVALGAVAIGLLVATRLVGWVTEQTGVGVSSDVRPVMTVLLFGVLTDYSIFFMARFRAMLEEQEMDRVEAAKRASGELLPVVATAGLVIALATARSTSRSSASYTGWGRPRDHGAGGDAGRGNVRPGGARHPRESDAVAAPGSAKGRSRRAHTGDRRACGAPRRAAPDPRRNGVLRLPTGGGDRPPTHPHLQPTDDEPARGFVGEPGLRRGERRLRAGDRGPHDLVVEGSGVAHERSSLAKLERLLSQQPGVAGVIGPADNPLEKPLGLVLAKSGNAARYMVVFKTDPLGARAISAVQTIRRRMPELLSAAGMSGTQALVGGDSALSADTANATHSDLLRVTPIALAVIFLMLALLLRALVAPVYLLAASVLGLLAALGLTTYFFEGVLGHSGISIFVPLTIPCSCSRWAATTTSSWSGGSGTRPGCARFARRSRSRAAARPARSPSPEWCSRARSARPRSSRWTHSASSPSEWRSAS